MDFKKALILLFITLFTSIASQAQTRHKKPAARKAAAGFKKSMANGQALFTQYCVACHQADGLGVPHMNPPLVNTTYVLGDKSKLIKVILNGFDEDVEINGETYSNTMAAHDFMKDREIADVLTYVRNSFGNKASAVTIAQVKATRATNKK
ncbi:cytochrome c [Mucilaginibacter sp. cycad4]|uniref:c-type cytochrome n=1 Tax=Mucilaginibacter sp. cycad4 TaxID=3342096 RepID=UPI002AAAD364|nr:cytochrome c [Mucilaginibacter gossypii]WPV01500.1 cytochrome c [Mucilaginibacter gossypii]